MVPDRISRVLTAYVDGELDAPQRLAVEHLLRRSSEARELLRGLQKDAERLHSLPHQTLGPDFSQQVLHTLASLKAESARRSTLTMRSQMPPWLGLATAAAAVLVVVGFRSHLYFATFQRPQPDERVAVKSLQPDPLEIAKAEITPSPAPEPSEPERLHSPLPEGKALASSAPAVASTADEKPQSEPKPPLVLTSPLRNNHVHLNDPEARLGLVFNLGDLVDQEKRQQLQRALQKGAIHAMDLRCTHTVAGMERLQIAFKSQGIRFVMDQDAQAALKLGIGKNTTFALYFEDVTAEEIVTVLQQLHSEDRAAERKRAGTGRFEGLMVNAMTREEQQKFWRLVGMDADRLDTPMPKESAGIDFRKLLANTEEGTSRSESARPGLKALDRQAMVMAFTPGHPRPISTELKRFVDQRGERRTGTLQIFLVLSSPKS